MNPANDPTAPIESTRTLAAVTYAAVVGEYSLLVMPFIVGAMMDGFGVSARLAGRIVSLQLAGMTISAVAISLVIGRLDRIKTVYVMSTLVVAANVVCATSTTLPTLLVARLATGLGEGALMAIAGSLAASMRNPRRSFSIIGFAVAIAASIALFMTPFLVDAFGRPGTFWFLALLAAGLLPLVHWLRPGVRSFPSASAQMRDGATAVPAVGSRAAALFALTSFGLFWAASSGLWVFAERIGLTHRLTLHEIGLYLGIGQLAGIAGPISLALLARRLNWPPIFAGSLLLAILSGVLFVYSPFPLAYCLGAASLSLVAMLLAPGYRTLMALLDRRGGVVAASVAFYTVGFGAAPLLITFFLGESEDFTAVAVVCSLLYTLALILVLAPARSVGRIENPGSLP